MVKNLKPTTGIIEYASERNLIMLTIRLAAIFPVLSVLFSQQAASISSPLYAAGLLYSLSFFWFANKSQQFGRKGNFFVVAADITVAGFLVLISGGLFGPFYLVSLASIITAEALVGSPTSVIASAFMAVLYATGSLLFVPGTSAFGAAEQWQLVEKLIGFWLVPVFVSDQFNPVRFVRSSAKAAFAAARSERSLEPAVLPDTTVAALQDSARSLHASLDQNMIVARLFRALTDCAGITGVFRLGFVDRTDGIITAWHCASSQDDAPLPEPNTDTRLDLKGDDPLARAVVEGRPICLSGRAINKLIVPLTYGSKALAVLEITTEKQHSPGFAKTEIVKALSDQAAVAVKNAQTVRSARKRAKKLSSLYEVSGQLHSKRVPERVIALVADYAKRFPQSEKVVTWLINEDSRLAMRSMVVRGCRRKLPETAWRADLVRLARQILKQKKPAIIRRYKLPDQDPSAPSANVFVLGIPLMSKDRVNGILIAMTSHPERYRKDDVTALSILGRLAGRAIENASLYQHTKKLAAFEERYRIAMDLHDGLAQALFSIALNLEVCQRLVAQDPLDVKQRLEGLQTLTLETLGDTRKYILELQPDGVMAHALPKIIKDYVRKFSRGNSLRVRSSIRGRPMSELPISIKQNLYRILQEALANIIKHAQATEAKVQLTFDEHDIRLAIEDNGIGFPDGPIHEGKASTEGMGLVNMHKRADMIGGQLTLNSLPGEGTKVLVQVSTAGDLSEN